MDIDPNITKVEFKVTALLADEVGVQRLLGKHRPPRKRRTVYFYDTKELALRDQKVFLRGRITEGDDDESTVKVRPVAVPDAVQARDENPKVKVELDVVGASEKTSAKLDADTDPGEIAREGAPAALFKDKQKRLIERFAPAVALDDLKVLGPIDARVWTFDPLPGFAYALGVEEWLMPDATRFLELSFKVDPAEAGAAQKAFHAFLEGIGLGIAGDQTSKTDQALKFFAARLNGA